MPHPWRYLWQAGRGQFALINRARPIVDVLKDERMPPGTRRLLERIPAIKAFGESQGLKATKNYTDFVKLNRPYASYVVSACEELSFKPKLWSFPIVGSVPYLGWFDRAEAEAYAEALRGRGWDAEVRGASAYSTLGWFRDAVLSSMVGEGPEALGELANVVLHESVHATFYLKNQSLWNESLASFIADELTPQYLQSALGEDAPELQAYRTQEHESEQRAQRFRETYLALEKVYANSHLNQEQKRAEKQRLIAALKKELRIPEERRLGNATLQQFKTYGTGRPEFKKLFTSCGKNWARFWKVIHVKSQEPQAFSRAQAEDFGAQIARWADDCPE